MGDGLWRHEASGIELREADESTEEAPLIELCVGDEARSSLGVEEAFELAEALRAWGGSSRSAPAPHEGTYYQVYHRHEYVDADGDHVALDGLGEPDDDGVYIWDEESLEAARGRVQRVGRAVAAAYEAQTGEAWSPEVEESARAWVSLFQMPEDSRLWKGFWDELDDVDDAELIV